MGREGGEEKVELAVVDSRPGLAAFTATDSLETPLVVRGGVDASCLASDEEDGFSRGLWSQVW